MVNLGVSLTRDPHQLKHMIDQSVRYSLSVAFKRWSYAIKGYSE